MAIRVSITTESPQIKNLLAFTLMQLLRCSRKRSPEATQQVTSSPSNPSPLGLVPRQDGPWHIIMDFSLPQGFSINDFTSKEDYTLLYVTFDHALATVSSFGTGALIAKLNLKHAYCLCPVSRSNWDLPWMHWQGKFFVELRLPFALHLSTILSLTIQLIPLSVTHFPMPYLLHWNLQIYYLLLLQAVEPISCIRVTATLFCLLALLSSQFPNHWAVYLAGIWFTHIENSLADLFADALFLCLLLWGIQCIIITKKIKHTIGLSSCCCLPVAMPVICQIKGDLADDPLITSQDKLMLWSAFPLGFFAFIPSSDFTSHSFQPTTRWYTCPAQSSL